MGLGSDSEGGGGGSPHAVPQPVFPLPPEYEEAKERKVASVADLRNAVKTVRHCDTSAISRSDTIRPAISAAAGSGSLICVRAGSMCVTSHTTAMWEEMRELTLILRRRSWMTSGSGSCTLSFRPTSRSGCCPLATCARCDICLHAFSCFKAVRCRTDVCTLEYR